MEKLKAYGCIFLGCISCFTYGVYVYASTHGNPPELYRWLLTGGFGIMFMSMGLSKLKDIWKS